MRADVQLESTTSASDDTVVVRFSKARAGTLLVGALQWAFRSIPSRNINPIPTMAKSQNSKKETKKAPLKSAQEKRLAKQAKKAR